MEELPKDVTRYFKSDLLTEIPKGFLSDHRTRSGTWARIQVLRGSVRLVFDSPAGEAELLTPELDGVIEPEATHHLEPTGPVAFHFEFYRRREAVET